MKNFTKVKLACYATNVTMSVVCNLSPVLFLTFRSLYGISYSLLGMLVLINFITQLSVDLIFSFFSHKFNISAAVKATPVIGMIGLILFAMTPYLLPNNIYLGLVIGTIIFSASSGFAEVLISPVIAAIPSENPEHEMSKLHSIYAWGVVGVIIISTVYLLVFGGNNWQWLPLFFVLIPLVASIFFLGSKLPTLETPEKLSGVINLLKKKDLWLCVFAIFLGGAIEVTMAQWSSSYLEQALGIDKIWGDIFGVALFSVMLGLGRSLYGKIGKNITKILFFSAIGAGVCYLTAALIGIPVIGLIACALTGFCAAMLWPGSLIVASDRFPTAGVFIYAMMAAGGDLGNSVGPQLVGVITDAVSSSPTMIDFASSLGISTEQLGMRCGLLVGFVFALIAVFVFLFIMKTHKKYTLPLSEPPVQK